MSFGGTMNRPGSQGFRPGSVSGAPPGTAQRGAQQAGQGQSLNTAVEVQARPVVMREGVRAMQGTRNGAPTTSHGPGRQVVDRSYYIGLIRPRLTELTAEIVRLREQEDQIGRNGSVLGQLQQKQKTIADEIGQLKNQLSDINFAVEQSTTGDADGISAQAHNLKQSNADKRRNVDKIFLAVKEQDSTQLGAKKQLEGEMTRLDEQLSSADPRMYQQFKNTRDNAYHVADQVTSTTSEIRSLEAKQDAIMLSLAGDPDKKRAATFVLQILKKRQQRDEMQRECSVTVEVEKQTVMQGAKAASADIDVLQRQVVECKDANADAVNRIAQLDDDLLEYSGDNARKFQELQDKDREMSEFMESFQAKEKEELDQLKDVEGILVILLEHISRQQTMKAAIPTQNAASQLENLSNEVAAKEGQLDAAKKTYERLQKQLAERKEELSKVDILDQKISGELEGISRKMEEQRGEIETFSNLEGLRQEIDQRKQRLGKTKTSLTLRRDAAKQHVHLLSGQFEAAKTKLNEDQVHTSLASQEQKLRLVWQSAFALEDFVRAKEKEGHYTGTKADCLRLAEEVNSMLLRSVKQSAAVKLPQ